ncbi:MAG: hypothetical protein QG588_85, partial [Candidatus Poribacteria bacterium]|nr:hypothetical protein [Candidatus Poribacteria bacterium]
TIAGKDYQVSFLVASWSYSTSKIVVEAESENKWPVVIDQEKFQLNPSESRIVKVTVKTEANLRKKTKHYLKLKAKASVLNNGKAEASAENWVEIIPRVSAGDERFHKIPMEFKIRGVTEQNGERKQGLQTMLSSMGTLDENGEKHVDLLLVWSDLSDKSVFGGHDEFHLSYWTDRYEVRLGDQFTFLSPLTEYYSYGRGAEGKVEFGNLTIGALKKKAQWIKAENSKTAAYISYLLDKKYKFGFNFVDHQPSDNRIFSFRSQLNPYKPVYVDLEAASGDENGKRDSAYFVNVTNTQKWLLANLKVVHAGPYYIGYYRDTDLKSTDITLTVWKFKLSGDFYSQKQNLQLNPAYYSAPFKRSYQSELSSTFLNTRLSVGYKDSLRRDLLPKSSFNYREKTLRIELSQSFPKLSLWLAGEKGNIENLFDEKTYDLRRYWFSAFYQPFRWQNISSYAEVEDESTRKTTVGVSTCSQIAEQTLFRITLNIGWQDNTRIFDIADIALEHRFSNDWHILFEGRRSSYRDWRLELDTTNSVLFEFGIPFRLPTSKNNNVGRLKGVIYDIESKAKLANVLVMINELSAVTNKNGEFIFSAIKTGKYYMEVDKAGIGLEKITLQNMPLEVTIEGGKETTIKLGVIRSATMNGRVVVFKPKNHNGNHNHSNGNNGNQIYVTKEGSSGNSLNGSGSVGTSEIEFVESYGLADVLVEASNGSEIKRRITDSEGRFEFKDLCPGKWNFKVNDTNLPEYHYLEKDTFDISLKPGEKEEILVRVLPKQRPVRIIKEGGTLKE